MKTTEEILIEQNRLIIDLLREIKETNRQIRNHHIYHGPKDVCIVEKDKPIDLRTKLKYNTNNG